MDTIELETQQEVACPEVRSEAGQALVEYGLILALVSLTALALTPIGQWVAARFDAVTAAF